MKTKIILLSIICCGFFAMQVEAATLYVDKNSVHGTCNNNYTYTQVQNQSTPWCTIQKATGSSGVAGLAQPGDNIIVADGLYNTQYNSNYVIFFSAGGTANNPITLKAENKWGAVIDGQNNTSACVGFNVNGKYIRVEDFEIKNCFSGILSNVDPAPDYNVIKGNWIHHHGGVGLDLAYDCSYWTIDSNVIHDIWETWPDRNQYHGIYISHDTSYTTVQNNVIYDTPYGWPIHIYQHGDPNPQYNNVVVNNTLDASANPLRYGSIIIAATSWNLLIQNNIFYDSSGGAAIYEYAYNSGKNVQVKNNLTNSSSMCGAGTGYDCNHLTFSGNVPSSDPLFVNLAGRDYHLQSNSPAISKGLFTNAPLLDFDGVTRGSTIDIGAYEYVGSDTTPPAAPSGLQVQ